MRRPRIAVTCQASGNSPKEPQLYLDSVSGSGGDAVYIGPDADISLTVSAYDGIIIPGGRDLDPACYGEQQSSPYFPEDPMRSAFEIDLIRRTALEKKPMLGICYGMQIINVAMGGSLYQDIATQTSSTIDHCVSTHRIDVTKNPYLSEGAYEVNSSHHQAVRSLGTGIAVFATAPDGIIEGIFGTRGFFLVGLQWHPERITDNLSRLIFRRFLEACHA